MIKFDDLKVGKVKFDDVNFGVVCGEVLPQEEKAERRQDVLVFDISMNKVTHIDEIHVQRVLNIDALDGILCKYKIRKPIGFDEIEIWHRYEEGYFPLMVQVINILSEKGYKPIKEPNEICRDCKEEFGHLDNCIDCPENTEESK